MNLIKKSFLLFLGFVSCPLLVAKEGKVNNRLSLLKVEKTEGRGVHISSKRSVCEKYPEGLFQSALDELISSPDKIVRMSESKGDELRSVVQGEVPSFNLFEAVFKDHPLSIFGECSSSYCRLSRINEGGVFGNLEARDFFEDRVVNSIVKFYPNKKNQLTITLFACGGMLSELKIVTMLKQKGYENIHLNLIDFRFRALVECSQLLCSENLPFNFCGESIRNNYRNFDISAEEVGENIPHIQLSYSYNLYGIRQLLRWFNSFSGNFSVSVYNDVNDYLADCKNRKSLMSDIVIGIDYIEPMSSGAPDYIKLVMYGLKKGGLGCSLIDDNVSALDCLYYSIVRKKKEFTSDAALFETARNTLFDSIVMGEKVQKMNLPNTLDPSDYIAVYKSDKTNYIFKNFIFGALKRKALNHLISTFL